MVWYKFKLLALIQGRYRKEHEDSLVNELNVNEEYKEAFRTNSYIEICSKVQGHLQIKNMDNPSSTIPLYFHLSECLLEPRPETLAHMIEGHNLHPLLVDYFKITTEACNLCELLLRSIHQTRANYNIIKSVIKLINTGPISTNDQLKIAVFRDLATFASIKNPLSTINPLEFNNTHNSHNVLLRRLTIQLRKMMRRIKLRRRIKKIAGHTVVVAYTAMAVTLLALAFHTIVGIVTAPALFTCSVRFFKKRKKLTESRALCYQERDLRVQLDVAAKGVYILINDFNTMSRLVRRLNDEIEHSKAVAGMCVRSGKIEMLKEVVREFRIEEESCFSDQLKELEQHIYLCFLTINRSRRLIVQEVMHGANSNCMIKQSD